MKKMLLLAMTAVTVILFSACDKDDENESGMTWIQAKIDFDRADDDGKGPEGQAFLFSLTGKYPKDLTPYVTFVDIGSYLCYLKDVNNKNIYSDYQVSFKSRKDVSTGKYINSSTITIYSNFLSSFNYVENGEYLLVLYFYTPYMTYQTSGGSVNTGGYTVAYKKVKFANDDSSVYTHTFPIDPVSSVGSKLKTEW